MNNTRKKVLEDSVSSAKVVFHTNKNGNVELRADVEKDTLWATQEQVAHLFEIDRSVVTKHINNILNDKEVDEKSNVQKMHIANADRPTKLYSLDVILSVGYRTSSSKAILFRKWATSILREYVTVGHIFNQHVLTSHPERLEGIHEALAFMESAQYPGKIKGRIILKVTKEVDK